MLRYVNSAPLNGSAETPADMPSNESRPIEQEGHAGATKPITAPKLPEVVSNLFTALITLILNINNDKARPVNNDTRTFVKSISWLIVLVVPYSIYFVNIKVEIIPEFLKVYMITSRFIANVFIRNVSRAIIKNNIRYLGVLNIRVIASI